MIRLALALLLFATPVRADPFAEGGFDLIAFFAQDTAGPGRSIAVNGVDRWRVSTQARREGGALRMEERFVYEDGRRRLQDWTIRRTATKKGRPAFVATRPDLDGPATFKPAGRGQLRYVWHQWLSPETRSNRVTLTGRLALRADGSMLNTATVWKWFIPIGRVRVVFRPTSS